MRKTSILAGLAALAVAGCVQHNWVPGPQVAGDFGQISGQCKLMSMGAPTSDGGFFVAGSPKFVGAAMGASLLVGGIASAVRQQNIYNACMESAGFVAGEGQ
jgi:hypothetical protein